MNLNQREKILVIGLGVVVGLLGLFYLGIMPFFERGATINKELARAREQMAENQQLLERQIRVMANFHKLQRTGVLRDDPYEAGQQVSNQLQTWGQESGVNVSALQPESPTQVSGDVRPDKPESKFRRVNIKATAFGNMRGLSAFLWRVESSPMVVRVTEIQIQSRKPATDDLQMDLTLATLSSVPPEAQEKPKMAGGRQDRSFAVAER